MTIEYKLFLSYPSEAQFDVLVFPLSKFRPASFVLSLAHHR